MTALEDAAEDMEAALVSVLGDTITFRAAGAEPGVDLDVWLFYDTARVGTGRSVANTDDIEIEVLKADIPAPSETDRYVLPKFPGKLWTMSGAARGGQGGNTWVYGLKRAPL